jgi:Winged helix-turn helix
MYRRTLILTPDQRAELVQTRDHDPRPYLRECAAGVLKVADGASPHAVARTGLLKPRHPDTLYDWLDRYHAHGLAGLIHKPRGHRGFSPSRRGGPGRDGPTYPPERRD